MSLGTFLGIHRNCCEMTITMGRRVKCRIKSTPVIWDAGRQYKKFWGRSERVNLSILKGALTGGAVMIVRVHFPEEWGRKKPFSHASYLLFLLSFSQGSLQPFQVTFQITELILQDLLAGTHVSSFIPGVWLIWASHSSASNKFSCS